MLKIMLTKSNGKFQGPGFLYGYWFDFKYRLYKVDYQRLFEVIGSYQIPKYTIFEWNRLVYKGHLESSKHHPKRGAIAEHFCCDNTLTLLIKVEKSELVLLVL